MLRRAAMSEVDFLNDLVNSSPNEPARNGTILLLGAEVRSGFKTLNARIDRLESRVDGLESRMDRLESRMGDVETRLVDVEKMLRAVSQQVGILVERSVVQGS
jgi:uncharacterized coiled-coil protein SlyX